MTHIAFLRAVNVGGRAVVKMTAVRDAFARAGCANVRTFIQSGNVLFDAPARGNDALFTKIRAAIRALLGHEPGICFRTLPQLDAVVSGHPFGPLVHDPTVKLYVVFLEKALRSAPDLPLSDAKEMLDIIAIAGRDAFIVSRRKPGGMYGFPNGVVERLGVMATSRNWSTVTKMVAFARIATAPAAEASASRRIISR